MQSTSTQSKSTGFTQRTLIQLMDTLDVLRPCFLDEAVTEIMINGPDDVFIKSKGVDKRVNVNLPAAKIRSAITLIATLSAKEVGDVARQPGLSARLPGFRVEAMLPPASVKGPSMCIRRHATQVYSLDDYIRQGVMSESQAQVIFDAIQARQTFLIAGGTGSGKTTLMNTALSLIPVDERLFVIEMVTELQILVNNFVQFECDPDQGLSAREGVRKAMRYAPDRVIMGELRGPEAYDWMDAANTGHPGSAATIHANSADRSLGRLENLLLMANMGVPYEPLRVAIGETLQWCFYIERRNDKRVLSQISRIHGYDQVNGRYEIESV
jgi:pilus assembly protein CpaF